MFLQALRTLSSLKQSKNYHKQMFSIVPVYDSSFFIAAFAFPALDNNYVQYWTVLHHGLLFSSQSSMSANFRELTDFVIHISMIRPLTSLLYFSYIFCLLRNALKIRGIKEVRIANVSVSSKF